MNYWESHTPECGVTFPPIRPETLRRIPEYAQSH